MKKILLSFLFLSLFFMPKAHAVTTWYACSGGGNWNGGSTWTSIIGDQVGCTGALGNPVAGDTAILNSSSGNVTITAAAAAAVITETGYTGTLAFGTQTLTVTGLCTILGAMTNTSGTLSCAGGVTLGGTPTGTFPTLVIAGSSTITPAGFTWPGNMSVGAFTLTLAANTAVTGSLTFTGACPIAGSFNLTVAGGLVQGANTVSVSSGSPVIVLTGGTWTGTNNHSIQTGLTFAGNVTVSGAVELGLGTVTYSSGTITTTGSTLSLTTSETFNTNGMSWNNITVSTAGTWTLSSDLSVTGTWTNLNAGTFTFSGAHNVSIATLTVAPGTATTNLIMPASQTLTVTTAINLQGTNEALLVVKSGTSSTSFLLNYTGTLANMNISDVTFTDVDASGSTNKLNNYFGNTLTRTTNIQNVNASNLVASSGGGFFLP